MQMGRPGDAGMIQRSFVETARRMPLPLFSIAVIMVIERELTLYRCERKDRIWLHMKCPS